MLWERMYVCNLRYTLKTAVYSAKQPYTPQNNPSSTTTDRTHQASSQPPIKALYSTLHYYKLLIQPATLKCRPLHPNNTMSCLSLAIIRPLIPPKSRTRYPSSVQTAHSPQSTPVKTCRECDDGIGLRVATRHMLLNSVCVWSVWSVTCTRTRTRKLHHYTVLRTPLLE